MNSPNNHSYISPPLACNNAIIHAALARWNQYREECSQPERNIVYERIVKAYLKYNIAVKYNPDSPEAKALPTAVKEKLEGYEAADSLIRRVKQLMNQLQA